MRRRLAALLACAPLPALAQGAQCWISYAGFEERVPHLDLESCPGDTVKPGEGFCRIALQGSEVLVYYFRHDEAAGAPCLVRVERAAFNDFVAARGPTYAPR